MRFPLLRGERQGALLLNLAYYACVFRTAGRNIYSPGNQETRSSIGATWKLICRPAGAFRRLGSVAITMSLLRS
jgi:hypothetical protein